MSEGNGDEKQSNTSEPSVKVDDIDNKKRSTSPKDSKRGGTIEKVRIAPGDASETSPRRTTEQSVSDRVDRYRNRKAERASAPGKDTPPQERANVPGAERVGASSDATTEKMEKNSITVGLGVLADKGNENHVKDDDAIDDNDDDGNVMSKDNNVPLAAEISDIHEENERLRRELEERHTGGGDATNIPVAQVFKVSPSSVDEDEEPDERCRPTKTNIGCAVLCFAVILGATIGIVVSASGGKTVEVAGSPQPSSPPTRTQFPSTAPSQTPPWLFVAEKVFSKQVEERISNEEFLLLLSQSPNGIIWRQCPNCTSAAHQNIYYKRITDPPAEERDFNGEIPSHFLDLFLNNWYSTPKNWLNVDFELYSSYEDAVAGQNRWEYCNYDQKKIGFPRDCAPNSNSIAPLQWTSFLGSDRYGAGVDHAFYVENDVPKTDDGDNDDLVIVNPGNPDDDDGEDTVQAAPTALPSQNSQTFSPSDGKIIFPDDDGINIVTDDDGLSDVTWSPTNLPVSAPTLIPVPTLAPVRPPFIRPPSMDNIRPVGPDLFPTNMPVLRPVLPPPTSIPVPAAPSIQPSQYRQTYLPSSYVTDAITLCPEDMIEFEFVVTTDFFGAETTWDLKGANGNTIVSGGPYGDFEESGVGSSVDGELYCIPKETCYSLNVYDEFGDGIYSPGGYRAFLGGTMIANVVGGTKFKTRAIDMARTVSNYPYDGTFESRNCEEVPIDSGCYTLEGFLGTEFLGRTNQAYSFSVIVGETFTETDMRTNSRTLVGNFESFDGNTAVYSGGDYCSATGGPRSAVVELVQSPTVDSVQTFFTQLNDCVVQVEIRVPACRNA